MIGDQVLDILTNELGYRATGAMLTENAIFPIAANYVRQMARAADKHVYVTTPPLEQVVGQYYFYDDDDDTDRECTIYHADTHYVTSNMVGMHEVMDPMGRDIKGGKYVVAGLDNVVCLDASQSEFDSWILNSFAKDEEEAVTLATRAKDSSDGDATGREQVDH